MAKSWIIPVIIIAQFCCTSLWFAGNAVAVELGLSISITGNYLVQWTVAVQVGFILGTLVLGFFLLADRYSPSKIFLISGLLGALFNLGLLLPNQTIFSVTALRFLTGFMLAGIYPVGMKIAADYKKEGLGIALGFLVGALVLGTAFPHLLKNWVGDYPWTWVIMAISGLSVFGAGLLFFIVKDGPNRTAQTSFDPSTFLKEFKNEKFRGAAFGYFGHMWEVYTLWAFTPFILMNYNKMHPEAELNVSFYSFAVIAMGAIGCIAGGYLAKSFSTEKISFAFLAGSLLCCLASVFLFDLSVEIFLTFMLVWGFFVAGDSPQFSTLVAKHASSENRGTSLTVVNGIGFSITILSMIVLQQLVPLLSISFLFVVLAIGPIIGLGYFARTF